MDLTCCSSLFFSSLNGEWTFMKVDVALAPGQIFLLFTNIFLFPLILIN